jgi:hypothetical protein
MRLRRVAARGFRKFAARDVPCSGRATGFRVLLYHSVGSRLSNDSYGISIRPALFESHMQLLSETEGVEVAAISRRFNNQSN